MRVTGQLLRRRSKKPLHIVRYIDLSSSNIVTLDLLKLCPKLTTLVARNNHLESIPELDCCPQLWKVDVAHNKLHCLNGLARFSVLGSLILSNNCLDWNDLEALSHIHIMEFSLHGNPKLEKEPYYRMHVIDSLPLLWMLDGRLITSAERRQVDKFFKESGLSKRPVRHKFSQKRFTPSSLKNLPVNGVFGEKTEHWMKRFPLHEEISQDLDRRRLRYLAYNLKEDVCLQSSYVSEDESKVLGDMFVDVLDERECDREKLNMLLLLLVAFLEFHIPEGVIQQTLEITKLNKIRSFNAMELFLWPKKYQCRLASLLLAGVKIDRDAKLEDGLYDRLYLCLYDLVSEWHKLSNGDKITRKTNSRNILAAEVVQLFCIVPAFLMLLGKHAGLLDLAASATNDANIADQVCDVLWKVHAKSSNPGDLCRELGSFLLKKVHQRHASSSGSKSDGRKPISSERVPPLLRTSSFTKTVENESGVSKLPRRAHSAVYLTKKDTQRDKSNQERESRRVFTPGWRSAVNRVALGDKVITADQTCGHVVALPDRNIALVRRDLFTARGCLQSNFTKTRDISNRFVYVDTGALELHHQGFWSVRKDVTKGNDAQTQSRLSERTSECFLAQSVKKQLPVEVWMSFSTGQSPAKSETTACGDSRGTVITKHVRALVKECLREAKTPKKTAERPEVLPEQEKIVEVTEQKDNLSQTEVFQEIEGKEAETIHQEKDDDDFDDNNDDMISKTENDRLQAWKMFRLRTLEERIIADRHDLSSVTQPHGFLEVGRHTALRSGIPGSVSPMDVYTSSGQRLSFPLPGWMEELNSSNQRINSARKYHELETKERWTPIISPAPVAQLGCRSLNSKGENHLNRGLKYERIHRSKRH